MCDNWMELPTEPMTRLRIPHRPRTGSTTSSGFLRWLVFCAPAAGRGPTSTEALHELLRRAVPDYSQKELFHDPPRFVWRHAAGWAELHPVEGRDLETALASLDPPDDPTLGSWTALRLLAGQDSESLGLCIRLLHFLDQQFERVVTPEQPGS